MKETTSPIKPKSSQRRLAYRRDNALTESKPHRQALQRQGVLDPRSVDGLVLGYGRQSHSYLVYSEGDFKLVRSVSRMPLSQRWTTDKLQEIQFTVQDQHLKRGAKAVPFTERDAPKMDDQGYRRAPRRLELRQ